MKKKRDMFLYVLELLLDYCRTGATFLLFIFGFQIPMYVMDLFWLKGHGGALSWQEYQESILLLHLLNLLSIIPLFFIVGGYRSHKRKIQELKKITKEI